MKKYFYIICILLAFTGSVTAQIVSVSPDTARRGQMLTTTITMQAGLITNATPPFMGNDLYLQQGATIIYATSVNWPGTWDPFNQIWTVADSGTATFNIPGSVPSGLYDVFVTFNPGPFPATYSMPNGFFIQDPVGTIQGNVFFDVNQNGIRDVNDPPLQNARIQIAPTNELAFSNSAGDFIYYADSGTYTTSYVPAPTFSQTTIPLTYTSTIPPSVSGNDFGAFSSSFLYAHSAAITRVRNRCNTTSGVNVSIRNTGYLGVQDRVYLITSSNSVFSSSVVPPDMVSGDTLMWITPVINAGSVYNLGGGMQFTIPAAMQTVTMNVIDSVFDLSGNFIDVYYDVFSYEVRCAYDPNDKHSSPLGVLAQHYTPINSELTYHINFQNTGNDTAYDVFILDTLDANLDPTTFMVLESSHPMAAQMTASGAVRFNFLNIMLPDSGIDEPGSHGWVTYKIRPDIGLPDPTVIRNTSYIIFDMNDPIVTNTTINTMTALQYPQANFTTGDVSICETDCIIYNNQSVSGTSYNWSFPGGSPSSSTASAPGAICYSTSGSYDVTLITTNALGSDTLIQPAYINVAVSPAIFSVVQSGDSLIAPQGYSGYEWYFNNVLIPDDTLYYHIATQNGDYGVVVSNPNGCQSGVNISNVTIGIYETVDSKLVTLYPNPTSDRVEISYNSMTNDIAFISIIDKIGQVVKSVEYKSATGSNKFELNTSELSSGIYTIQISIGSKLISKMLMINK